MLKVLINVQGNRKDITDIEIEKEIIKLYLFASGMTVYVEQLNEYVKKIKELILEFLPFKVST